MSWVKIDDSFPDHRKLAELGSYAPLCGWLYVCGLAFCNRQLTDGLIPKAHVRRLVGFDHLSIETGGIDGLASFGETVEPNDIADLLVRAGLWEDAGTHYRVHDYLHYQPSRDETLRAREISKRRAAMHANPGLAPTVKKRDRDACRYCGTTVNWTDRKGRNGGTYDHVVPLSCGGDESVENLVVCCRQCNERKGPRTPEQAGMTLSPAPGRIKPESESESESDLESDLGLIRVFSRTPDPDPDPPDTKSVSGSRARRPQAAGALAGTLPRDHVDHGFCGARFCVKANHVNELVRRYGDGGAAFVPGWLARLDASLGAEDAAGDWLWVLRHFEADPAYVARLKPSGASAVPDADETRRRMRAAAARAGQ